MIRRPSGLLTPATTDAGPSLIQHARIRKNTSQEIAAFASTPITYSVVEVQYGTSVDVATADALVIVDPGFYLIDFQAWMTGGGAGERNVDVRLNGTVMRQVGITTAGRLGAAVTLPVSTPNAVVTTNIYTAVNEVTLAGTSVKDTGLAATYLGPIA